MNVLADIPMPTCCDEAKKYPAVRFEVDILGADEPQWKAAGHSFNLREMGFPKSPAAKFCPFCGTSLPKMQRKENPPSPIATCTDGGYYCATCNERLNCCDCRLPESAWEPVSSSSFEPEGTDR